MDNSFRELGQFSLARATSLQLGGSGEATSLVIVG